MVVYDDASGWIGVAVNGSSLAAACGIVRGRRRRARAAVTLDRRRRPTTRAGSRSGTRSGRRSRRRRTRSGRGARGTRAPSCCRRRTAASRAAPSPSWSPGCRPGMALGGVLVRAPERRAGRGTALLERGPRAGGLARRDERCAATLWIGPDGEGRATLDWARPRGVRRDRPRARRGAARCGDREPPAVDPPDGVRIVSWAERARPRAAAPRHRVARPSRTSPARRTRSCRRSRSGCATTCPGPYDRPEAVLVALAGDEAVGYAKLHLPAARGDVAVNDLTAVRRTWRGRGVAGALKRAQLGWAIRNGYTSLETAQRGAQRADPRPQRPLRLPAGRHLGARRGLDPGAPPRRSRRRPARRAR